MEGASANYRHLDSQKIIETVQTLKGRIERRFPESGLSKLAGELLKVAEETVAPAILFFQSWENRIKRKRALKAVHELRAMAHIVDMHQLTKDPESYFAPSSAAAAPAKRRMTPFELNRYLDYCSETLALVSKIAALYVQDFQDPVLLDAVDDIEDLVAGFSRKIWQKITILETLGRMDEKAPNSSIQAPEKH